MKTKKVLLGSLVLASVVSACTDENIVEGVNNNVPLTERTQVNLSLSASEIESRMSNGTGWGSAFETHDVLGAVLVDKGFIADPPANWTEIQWNNVDWTVVGGHVGNNKWFYDANKKKFVTEGTTAVGSWLFYTKYNEEMTKTRNGVEFDFPQIQEGAADLEWVMNNNANFMVSPVVHIDGYEGQNLDFSIRMASVFNYLRMPFDLKATGATKVQKIVVKANSAADVSVSFPTEYKVNNVGLPEARLSLDAPSGKTVKCPNVAPLNVYDVTDQNAEMDRAYNELVYATSAKNFSTTTGTGAEAVTVVNWDNMIADYVLNNQIVSRNVEAEVPYLVVDLDGEHTDKAGKGGLAIAADGKFSAVMLMPAGVYYSLTFDIYTDKGVYTKTISERNAYRYNANGTKETSDPAYIAASGLNQIFLRPGRVAVLSDIEGKVAGSNYAETLDANEYIKVIATDKLTGEQYITKTADLINFINGITAKGSHRVNVMAQASIGGGANDDELIPEHAVIVNQAVMTAIEAKETELAGDIQIDLVGATVKVKGNAAASSALNIHDLTFSNGADLISGYVKATESVNVPAEQKMLVKTGVNLELALAQATGDKFNSLEVENGAIVNATTTASVDNVLNKGTFSIAADKTIASANVENKGVATVNGTLNVATSFVNAAYATLTNVGEMTLAGTASNNGTLTNNKNINVHGAMTNNSNVTIAANAKIHVNSSATASLLNNGTITNSGMLYTKVGYNNTITNLGTIDAKSASTTYITKNSKADETKTPTNVAAQVMGTLKIAERNLDITVTENNYQGYIEYTPVAADIQNGVFDVNETNDDQQDKFNKVIFSSAVKLSADAGERVKYIVTSKNLNLVDASINEVTFTANATLYAQDATIASLTIAKDVLVKVPTINKVKINTINTPSLTNAEIHNEGELLVGGDLYTTIISKEYTTGGGEFSAGDGNASAFHWNTGDASTSEGYQVTNGTAVVVSQSGLNSVLAMSDVKEVKLPAGEYSAELYNITEKSSLTIKGEEGTKLAIKNLQLRASQFNELVIENCIIDRMPDKSWGHLVFGSSDYPSGVYTVRNCTFNGVGSQGIYINENTSGVTYNIENCTFNGDFGTEGAVTIQNNAGVEVNINVIGCTFNNIPATSHKIFVMYDNNSMNLNTDVAEQDIFNAKR